MYDSGFLEYAMWNIESFPLFLQTVQLPSSELMSLGTSLLQRLVEFWKTFTILHGNSLKPSHENLSTRKIQCLFQHLCYIHVKLSDNPTVSEWSQYKKHSKRSLSQGHHQLVLGPDNKLTSPTDIRELVWLINKRLAGSS